MKEIIERIRVNWKRYLIPLVLGLFLGWIMFGGRSEMPLSHQHDDEVAGIVSAVSVWTCSMHPQIKQNEPGSCPLCGMDLVLLKEESDANPAVVRMTETAIRLANIQTTVVERGKAEREIVLQGKVMIDERRIASQSAHFNGRIERLHINFEGERVRKGQTLATVYAPQLITAQEELHQAKKTAERYPDLLKAARNKLKLWKLTDKQIERIEGGEEIQEYFDVRADVSGYVTKRNVSEGSYVKTGDQLFKIANLDRLWVIFDAYERDVSFIERGDRVKFTVSSLPDKVFTAIVSYVNPVLDPKLRIASVRTEIGNRDQLLKPEMFAEGKVISNTFLQDDVLVIPKSAVMWTGKRSVVYVRYDGMPMFEMREVVLGESLGDYYIVTSGIDEGERIVTHGTFTVDAAAQLSGSYSMMNRPEPERESEQVLTSATFKVSGNCDMCKTNIETAAKGVTGVIDAEWNKDTKIISIRYDRSKVKLDEVHQAIAKTGYDTDKVKGDDEAYDSLYECCKYRE